MYKQFIAWWFLHLWLYFLFVCLCLCLFVCLFVFRWSNLAAELHRSHSTHWFLLRWLQISEVQRHCILPNASKAFIKPGLCQRYKHNLGKTQKNGHKLVSLFSYIITSVSWFVCLHVFLFVCMFWSLRRSGSRQETSAAALIVAVGSDYERCGLDIGFGSINCLD